MDLPDTILMKLCQVNSCLPSDRDWSSGLVDEKPKRIRLTNVDYASALASHLSTEDLLRQLPLDAQRKLAYQDSELKRKWKLDEHSEKEVERQSTQEETIVKPNSESSMAKDDAFDSLVEELCLFRPPRRLPDETAYEYSLNSYLFGRLPKARIESQYKLGDTRCDLKVDDCAIELKKSPSNSELRRLYEQIARYSKYPELRKIVVMIFDADVQSTTLFCDTLMQNPAIDRITVIGDYRVFMKNGKRVSW